MFSRTIIAMVLFLLPAQTLSLETAQSMIDDITAEFTGDLPQMRERGIARVLIPFSRTMYFIEDGHERGLAVEALLEFENSLNARAKSGLQRLRLVLIPTRRDRLIPSLLEGRGDIAVGNLTITEDRLEKVDFSDPFINGVREVLATREDFDDAKSVSDFAGLKVHVRKSASYYQSLQARNEELAAQNLAKIETIIIDDWLEDEDLLEMLNAGAIDAMVIDEHKAMSWLDVFGEIKIHTDVPLREGGQIGWAFRKKSPQLAQAINAFQKTAAQGTLLGNIFLKRYYSNSEWIKNPKQEAYQKKLDELLELFEKNGAKYRIDPLLLAALAFQESKFDNSVRSKAGAVGIMQILPSTANDPNVGIGKVEDLKNNIEAGTKYIRYMADTYFSDEDIPENQRILMALASYNAGPNKVARARSRAKDPNIWFENVEWEVAKAAGSEPVRYVKNINVYYTILKSTSHGDQERQKLLESINAE